jgi:hypothetical protein
MSIVILLLIIPVFSVGLVLYITNLYEFFVTGNFNELLFIISMSISVVTGYFIPCLFVNLIKSNKIKYLNNKNKYLIISNYISLILLFMLGIALLYRGLLNLNYGQLIFGIGIIFLFFYGTYAYFMQYEEDDFILKVIYTMNGYNELHFVRDDISIIYYTDSNKYKENQRYVLKYNKYINSIKKINGMVLGGETHEKNNKEKHEKETSRV